MGAEHFFKPCSVPFRAERGFTRAPGLHGGLSVSPEHGGKDALIPCRPALTDPVLQTGCCCLPGPQGAEQSGTGNFLPALNSLQLHQAQLLTSLPCGETVCV